MTETTPVQEEATATPAPSRYKHKTTKRERREHFVWGVNRAFVLGRKFKQMKLQRRRTKRAAKLVKTLSLLP